MNTRYSNPASPKGGAPSSVRQVFKSFEALESASMGVKGSPVDENDFENMSDEAIKARIELARKRVRDSYEERNARFLSRVNAAERRERDYAPLERIEAYRSKPAGWNDSREHSRYS